MKVKQTLIPIGALVIALGVGPYTVEAGQRDRNGRDRNGRASQGQPSRPQNQDEPRARGGGQDRGGRVDDNRGSAPRAQERRGPVAGSERRDNGRRDNDRGNYNRPDTRVRPLPPANNYRYTDRFRYDGGRYNGYRYYGTPRVLRPAPRRYYGPGGNFSVYFGLGSGYLYGSPWSGRVYGYRAPYAYGARVYYGDVRLQVHPRDAAVYVDGYYAGVVDDFDGVFQRLTLEVGPHQIELDAPGFEPQVFDIYVDPARTTTIRADLFR